MKYRLICTISLLILASVSTLLSASKHKPSPDFQKMSVVLKVVDSYVKGETETLPGEVIVSQGKIDNRITLPKCSKLEAFVPTGSRLWGNASVGVRCNNPSSWTIYVQINIQVMADVIHAARPLTRGTPLVAEDIKLQRVNLTQMPEGIFTELSQVIGKVPLSSLSSGQLLRQSALRLPHVILRGQKVTLHIQGQGFSVSSEGIALADASEGQVVQVRNEAGRVISGIARDDGIVVVRP